MSLVDPRSEVPKYVEAKKNECKKILTVKPCIIDYAAIEFIDEEKILKDSINPEELYLNKVLPIKIKYYKKYIKNYFKDT